MRQFLYLLFIIVIFSGCTQVGGGSGVIIESFQPDFREVFPEEQVNFRVLLRNIGSVDARDIQVTLLGLEEWKNNPSPCTEGVLLAPQQSIASTGDTKSCQFSLRAPSVPPDIPVAYQATARVTYSYSSTFIKTVTIGSQDELRRIQDSGAALPSETAFATNSPLVIGVVNKGPIRVFEQSITFPVEITVSNAGGGVPCDPSCQTNENWNKVRIAVSLGGDENFLSPSSCTKVITLFRGQSNTFTCHMTVEKPPVGILQKTIKAEAEYKYFFDATTPITVTPLPA